MSQDFEFNEPQPPSEPFKPVSTTPPVTPKPTPVARPAASVPDPLYRSPISILGGLMVSLALLGGLGFLGYDAYKDNPAAPAEAADPKAADAPAAPAGTPDNATAMPAPTPTPAADPSGSLASQVAELQASLKTATSRLDELSSKPAPDLKAVEDKLGELSKTSETVAGLSAKVAAIDEKVGAMGKPAPADSSKVDAVDQKVGELASALGALKAEVAALATLPAMPARGPESSGTAKPPEDINVADQAMSQAVELFKQRKYAESLEKFTKLQADHPEDARVWYFSALARGLATRDWRGETERLVNLGVEKEKAGTPDSGKIDAVFADLSAASGKDWLSAYRARASSR